MELREEPAQAVSSAVQGPCSVPGLSCSVLQNALCPVSVGAVQLWLGVQPDKELADTPEIGISQTVGT